MRVNTSFLSRDTARVATHFLIGLTKKGECVRVSIGQTGHYRERGWNKFFHFIFSEKEEEDISFPRLLLFLSITFFLSCPWTDGEKEGKERKDFITLFLFAPFFFSPPFFIISHPSGQVERRKEGRESQRMSEENRRGFKSGCTYFSYYKQICTVFLNL